MDLFIQLEASPAFPCRWRVDKLAWSERGGPRLARLSTDPRERLPLPPDERPAALAALLGRPLTVYDGEGEPVWWGYVHAVEVPVRGARLGWSLSGLANRVAVVYEERPPDMDWLARPAVTGWVENAASVARYGRKERRVHLPPASPAQAEDAALSWLERLSSPQPALMHGGPGQRGLRLEARGWWETLDWVYYAQPAGLVGYTGGGAVTLNIGYSTTYREYLQAFSPEQAWSASELWVTIGRSGVPDDELEISLVRWNGSAVTETLALWRRTAELTPNARSWMRLDVDPPLPLQPGAGYGVRLRRTGAVSSSAYWHTGAARDPSVPGGLYEWSGTAWVPSTRAEAMVFRLSGERGALEQAADLLRPEKGGQFFSAVSLPPGSGPSLGLYRSGENTALHELKALLDAGDDRGRRLLARVDPGRQLVIHPLPGEDQAELQMAPGGQLCDLYGRPAPLRERAAGRRVLLGGQPAYVTEEEWTPRSGRVLWFG